MQLLNLWVNPVVLLIWARFADLGQDDSSVPNLLCSPVECGPMARIKLLGKNFVVTSV